MAAQVETVFEPCPGGEGVVARITLDNPPLNLLGSVENSALTQAISQASGRSDLRALVLSGAGSRAFFGGAQVNEMAKLDGEGAEVFIRGLHEVCQALRDCPAPTIARINGHCIGGGLEVAASCDLRIASTHGKYGMPEVRIGIPSVIEAALLPRLIGWTRTAEFLMLAEYVDAATMERWGFLNRVVDASELDSAVNAALASLGAGSAGAIRQQKALMREWEHLALDAAVEAGVVAFRRSYDSDEPNRLMAALLKKINK